MFRLTNVIPERIIFVSRGITLFWYRTTTIRSVLHPYFPTELLSFVADFADRFGDSVYFNAIGSAGSIFSGQIMKIRTISSLWSLFFGTSNSLLNKTRSASILEPQLRLFQSKLPFIYIYIYIYIYIHTYIYARCNL